MYMYIYQSAAAVIFQPYYVKKDQLVRLNFQFPGDYSIAQVKESHLGSNSSFRFSFSILDEGHICLRLLPPDYTITQNHLTHLYAIIRIACQLFDFFVSKVESSSICLSLIVP